MEKSQKKNNSFIEQAAILAIASITARLLGFVYKPFLTDMIGENGMGTYSVGYQIYNFFLIVSSAGLPAAISKMVSEKMSLKQYNAAHQVFKVSLFVATILGGICSVLLWLGADFFANLAVTPEAYYTILTLAPTVFIVAIMAVFRGYFQGLNNTVPTAISQVIEQVFKVIFTLLLAYLMIKSVESKENPSIEAHTMGAAGATAGSLMGAIAGLLVLIWIYYLAKPSIKKRLAKDVSEEALSPNKEVAINLLKLAIPIILGTAIFSISNLIDTAMVKDRLLFNNNFTKEEADILFGRLQTKYVTITTLPVSISTAVAAAAIPSIAASYVTKDRESVKNKVDAAYRVGMMLSIPSAIGLAVLADPVINLIFPNTPGGADLLRAGALSVIFLALTQISTGMLQSLGKVHIPVIGAIAGTIAKIPLNYFLISNKNINIMGAIISTTVCYIITTIIDWYFVIKITKIKPDFVSILIKPMVASIGMGAGVYIVYNTIYFLTKRNTISTFVSIIFGVVLYMIIMILTKGLREEDLLRLPMGSKINNIVGRFIR